MKKTLPNNRPLQLPCEGRETTIRVTTPSLTGRAGEGLSHFPMYLTTRITQFDLAAALATVSEQRREYAMRYHQEHDRRLSVAAYQLLQQALREEYGINEAPWFDFGKHGKPILRDHPDIHFSLSHCRHAAACAVDNQPVGIDVESLDNYDPSLLPATMNEAEQAEILRSPNPSIAFLRLWTMKESYLKTTGEGIVNDMRTVLTTPSFHPQRYQFHTTIYPQFVCTLCKQN